MSKTRGRTEASSKLIDIKPKKKKKFLSIGLYILEQFFDNNSVIPISEIIPFIGY